MEIVRHEGIEKDFKDLKRFVAPQESLEAWERLFSLKGINETASIDRCSGFGDRSIYKARVVPLRENIGKSKGYRVIFEFRDPSVCTILIFSRHGIYHTEGDLVALIKKRL
jgi:hypothetical protein